MISPSGVTHSRASWFRSLMLQVPLMWPMPSCAASGMAEVMPPAPLTLQREASLHELRLELRVDHVRLHDRVHVLFVDLDDAVHAPHVELDAARPAGVAVDAPAGAGGLELHAELVAEPHDGLHLFGAARHDDGFEARLEVLRHGRLARAPRPGVQVDGVVGDVLRPDDGLEGLILLFG